MKLSATASPSGAPLQIWGRISSINVRKAVWAAQEVGCSFERIDAGREFGVVKTPAFLAHNPNGTVPALIHGDLVLWESNVIVRYLCAQFSNGLLYPNDLGKRFDAERWMDWQQTTFNGAGRDAFWQLIRTPQAQRDAALVAASIAKTEPLLAMLDAHLAQRAHMCGDVFGMADLVLGCEAHRWFALPIAQQALPHVRRWYASLAARPAARGVLDIAIS